MTSRRGRDMGRVVTYRNEPGRAVYCLIELDSGDRVLILLEGGEVKLVRSRLGGRLPATTMWSCGDPGRLIALFGDPANPGQHPLEAIRDKIVQIPSIDALQEFLTSA